MTAEALESNKTRGSQPWFRGVVTRHHFLLLHLAPVLPLAALLLALERTAIDDTITGWFFDRSAGAFPLRYNAFLEVIAHQYMKELVIVVACCVIAVFLLSFVLPELKPQRRLLLFLSLSLTLAPLAVVLLKATSVRLCPWNLLEYVGFAHHLTLLDSVHAGLTPGQ
jgi:membrane-associated PAP2 superfamily phosphatase